VRTKFIHVDTEECPTISKQEQIQGIPAFKFYVNGELLEDSIIVGAKVKELQSKVAELESLLGADLNQQPPPPVDSHSLQALDCFHENIDFSLEGAVPKPRKFIDALRERVSGQEDFCVTKEDREILKEIEELVCNSDHDEGEAAYLKEIVAEAEKEEEQERENEQEREVELEVFVAKDWSREDEEPVPWEFNSLAETTGANDMIPQMYPTKDFKLWKRESVGFPDYSYVTENYFNPKWNGDRRIKNVVMVLEMKVYHQDDVKMADVGNLDPPPLIKRLTSGTNTAMSKAFHYLDLKDKNLAKDTSSLHLTIRAAMDFHPTPEDLEVVKKMYGDQIGLKEFEELLRSDTFREQDSHRFFVGVSLAEAETLRRIIHLKPVLLPNSNTQLCLRCKTADYQVFDTSRKFEQGHAYQTSVSKQAFRYLDCDTYFQDPEINVLIRSMQNTEMLRRRVFFQQIIGCKRRLQKTWAKTPISKFFNIKSEFHFLKSRALTFRIRQAIKEQGFHLWDAFILFDTEKTGVLSGSELWGALEWLGINVNCEDLLELLQTYDIDNDGNLSHEEFFNMLRDPDAKESDEVKEDESNINTQEEAYFGDIVIKPKFGDDEWTLDALIVKKEELLKEAEEVFKGTVVKIEHIVTTIQDKGKLQRRADKGLPPNPDWNVNDGLILDYKDSELPIGGRCRGVKEFCSAEDGSEAYMKVESQAMITQSIRHHEDEIHAKIISEAETGFINQYTISVEVMFDKRPTNGNIGLLQILRHSEKDNFLKEGLATLYVDDQGSMGTLEHKNCLNFNSRVPLQKWCILTITVDCLSQMISLYNGAMKVWDIAEHPHCIPDGKFAVDPVAGFALFGAEATDHMIGGTIQKCTFLPRIRSYEEIMTKATFWEESSRWNCPICTVRNSINTRMCGTCGHKRPAILSKMDRKEEQENPILMSLMERGFPAATARKAMNDLGSDNLEELVNYIMGGMNLGNAQNDSSFGQGLSNSANFY